MKYSKEDFFTLLEYLETKKKVSLSVDSDFVILMLEMLRKISKTNSQELIPIVNPNFDIPFSKKLCSLRLVESFLLAAEKLSLLTNEEQSLITNMQLSHDEKALLYTFTRRANRITFDFDRQKIENQRFNKNFISKCFQLRRNKINYNSSINS